MRTDLAATLPEKVRPRHQERQAVVYVRQSTVRQVTQNRESTRLQYGLAERIGTSGGDELAELVDAAHGSGATRRSICRPSIC